ncbi:unnamed protein product [Cuscuta europaea]|uniref:Cytochrome b5 heme-binding domain-containing protein n=1 Tax=Cuscuta europaea TaxID=41803 RepID=A0A9P0YRE6_CUSEU|nr:unnamed protein product [Cuscuta europaea]
MGGSKVYSLAEISEHNNNKDCWLLIGGKIYDVTKFLEDHPGGDDVLLSATGMMLHSKRVCVLKIPVWEFKPNFPYWDERSNESSPVKPAICIRNDPKPTCIFNVFCREGCD